MRESTPAARREIEKSYVLGVQLHELATNPWQSFRPHYPSRHEPVILASEHAIAVQLEHSLFSARDSLSKITVRGALEVRRREARTPEVAERARELDEALVERPRNVRYPLVGPVSSDEHRNKARMLEHRVHELV